MILLKTDGIDIGGAEIGEANRPADLRLRHDWPNAQIHLHVQHPSAVVLADPVALTAEQARKLATTLFNLADSIDGSKSPHHIEGQTQDQIGRFFHDVADIVNVLRNDSKGNLVVGLYPHSVVYGWNAGRPATDVAADLAANYAATQG